MKRTGIIIFGILAVLSLNENPSHAFAICASSEGAQKCWDNRDPFGHYSPASAAWQWWSISTTFTGPLAFLADGQADLTRPDIREAVLAQADQVLNGQGESINQSENVVHALAQTFGAKDDESMARVLQSLGASGTEFTDQNIREAIK